MDTLETARLLLRPWSMEDLADFNRYCQDSQVGPNAGWKPHESLEESRGILEGWIKGVDGEMNWAVVPKETGRASGSISLMLDGRRPEVPNCREMGYVLSREEWGKGYMTEAAKAILAYGFETLGLEMISINHYAYNSRSRRVIEKCGFTYEGTLRRGAGLYDGRVEDVCCYSMTAQEYQKLNKVEL